ncbi:MAG: cytochrome-c peroxidase [Planctomycetota bacterium]
MNARFARSTPALALALLGSVARAQGPGPLPPPPPPPLGNPQTPAKINLGKLLFWDEQLSSTRTVSCATCHIPEIGGSDPRSDPDLAGSTHPGFDAIFGNDDDVHGSPGVIRSDASARYQSSATFGLSAQVTPRKAPSVINAAYAPLLFWDGRATGTFIDPATGQVALQQGAALESQAIAPLVNDVEMAHMGRSWPEVIERVIASRPLALAQDVPPALAAFVANRSYPQIFQEAFGTPVVTAPRIAMAIASYERTQFSNQAPIDTFFGGQPNALTPLEQQGLQVFNSPQASCVTCHTGNLFTNQTFRYIGVRPTNEDVGRFAVTNNPGDLGRMRVPSLRNVELRAPYFHNGSARTLEDVVAFYNRGGDFDAPNKDPLIRPLGLTVQQRAALVAFLRRPLSDPRVAAAQAPFDHPTLFAGSSRQPELVGGGHAGSGGFTPRMIAIEPPLVGNPTFTVGIERGLGGAFAGLVIDLAHNPIGAPFAGAANRIPRTTTGHLYRVGPLQGAGAGNGWTSIVISIPADPSLIGRPLYGQWFVRDAGSGGLFCSSEVFHLTHFD